MSFDKAARLKHLLREYVEKSSNLPELHWDRLGTMRLLFDPYSPAEREKSAHYFLLIAAIDRRELVGTSENAAALAIAAHRALRDLLFETGQEESLMQIVRDFDTYYMLGEEKHRIPEAIDAINTFVKNEAGGSLIDYAARFGTPEDMVHELSRHFQVLIGEQRVEHAWMYLRWMVRAYPDLHIFTNFAPKQLQIPLTSFVRKVAYCLELIENQEVDWADPAKNAQERESVTRFAAELFPEDPTIVDYPFYILGRWIRDEKLSAQLLVKHLEFWKKIYEKLKKPPITFEIASRNESMFERNVRSELEKLHYMFLYEPYLFPLPEEKGAPHYKADFLLPRCRKKGRIVILEPHGPWTPQERIRAPMGKRSFWIMVNPINVNESELRFSCKMRVFREIYKEMYYLILIVPSIFRERVKWDYPDIYDELYDGADIPKLLFDLKKHME